MISWKETRKRLSEDKKRLFRVFQEENVAPPFWIIFNKSYLCCFLFRLANYCYQKNWRLPARTIWYFNLFFTGANINPAADVGGGVYMNIPLGVTLYGTIGRNFTFIGVSAVMKGRSWKDVGGGPGMPVVGDNVSIGYGATILGPIVIGSNTRIGPHCCIDTDLPENSVTELEESIKRVLKRRDSEENQKLEQ